MQHTTHTNNLPKFQVVFGMWNSICSLEKNFKIATQQKDPQKRDLFLCISEVEELQANLNKLKDLYVGYHS